MIRTLTTVKIGTCFSWQGLAVQLIDVHQTIDQWLSTILPQVKVCNGVQEVNLVAISVADLGFKKGGDRRAINSNAVEKGVLPCTHEVAIQTRLQYSGIKEGQVFVFATERVKDTQGNLNLFVLERKNGIVELRPYSVDVPYPRDDFFPPETVFVYIKSHED